MLLPEDDDPVGHRAEVILPLAEVADDLSYTGGVTEAFRWGSAQVDVPDNCGVSHLEHLGDLSAEINRNLKHRQRPEISFGDGEKVLDDVGEVGALVGQHRGHLVALVLGEFGCFVVEEPDGPHDHREGSLDLV